MALSGVAERGQLLTLWDLSSPNFAHLGQQYAQLAYLQSYAFIEYLARGHGERSVRRLCDTLMRKRDVDRAFKVTFRTNLEDLERNFAFEYGSSGG